MAKETKISNGIVTAAISTHGAEVTSFKKIADDIEMIWQRNPDYWSNCNPILFPYTGALIDGKYEINGQTYSLGQHGFARHAEFEFIDIKSDSCKLHLKHDDYTMSVYPYMFDLAVEYRLNGSRLEIKYCVTNMGEEDLPFNIGFHPAFNTPMVEGKKYEDYYVELEQIEELNNDKVQIGTTNKFMLKDYLLRGSWFFHNGHIQSKWAQLTDGTNAIRVGCEGFQTLGFWRKNEETPFMCIEPWHPKTDLKKAYTFRNDTENNLLPPHQQFYCQYYFEIL